MSLLLFVRGCGRRVAMMEQIKYVVFIIAIIVALCVGYTLMAFFDWILSILDVCLGTCGKEYEQ